MLTEQEVVGKVSQWIRTEPRPGAMVPLPPLHVANLPTGRSPSQNCCKSRAFCANCSLFSPTCSMLASSSRNVLKRTQHKILQAAAEVTAPPTVLAVSVQRMSFLRAILSA